MEETTNVLQAVSELRELLIQMKESPQKEILQPVVLPTPMSNSLELKQTPQKEILTPDEVLELFQISRSTFDTWRDQGIIKVYSLRRRLYCKYSELIQALDQNPAQ